MQIFEPLKQRGVTLRNRIGVSPMCQYSCVDGFASDWHLVHLGSRAVGGAGIVIAEATAVEARGRISPGDLGIWTDAHVEPLARIARFIREHGAVPGIQLAHAGRKASTKVPWEGGTAVAPEDGGWTPVAPSAIQFAPDYPMPETLTSDEIAGIVGAFARAAERALAAGFEVIELHAAHGYLMHSFFSPLSNQRDDEYGGSLENRIRIGCDVVRAVRAVWPERLPLWLRISATDWAEGGWDIEESIGLARAVKPLGIDLIDCSSGGLVPHAKISVGPGYQVPFASRIRREANVATAAVGMITSLEQAEGIVTAGDADVVLMAREFLRSPFLPMHADRSLVPVQYERAFPRR